MRYLLDTNIVSELVRNPSGPAARRARVIGGAICVSVIVAAELRFGCAKNGSTDLRRRIDEFLAEVPVLPFDRPADEAYGTIRAGLEKRGRVVGSNDMLIAAHALALSATLVSADVGEFQRVEGLVLENWLA